ncbi:hypothetical protein [Allosphingosinicella sp.]|uniref:hypothetical protein n=1 Tax=Allosphingosinicella sp. TaxID=2823234 RepID=UPI003784CEF4
MSLAYLPIAIIAGLALDWAFVDRFQNVVRIFWGVDESHGYRDLLFPRVIVTIFGSALMFLGGTASPVNALLVFTGAALFLLSTFYADYRLFRGARRR